MIPSGHTDDEAPDARWCNGVSAALAGAAEGAGRLAQAVAEDWRDGHGQEWAERATLLHRELGRVAAEAAEIGAAIARRATEAPEAPDSGTPVSWQESLAPLRPAVLGAAAHDRGPRLGAIAGDRTETDLGMRIAELPESD